MENRQDFERFAVQWLNIPGYENIYQVSDQGEVRSFKTHFAVVLKPNKDANTGYYKVTLHKNKTRKTFNVHELVSKCFLCEKPAGRIVIDHKDKDRLNNKLSNLHYITHRNNLTKDRVSKSGYTGVQQTPSGTFRAAIEINNKRVSLGTFKTKEQARDAYQNKLKSL